MRAEPIIKKAFSHLTSLFIPHLCPSCGDRLNDSEEFLCAECLMQMERCSLSAKPQILRNIIANAPAEPGITASWAHYHHSSHVARIIRSIKYGRKPQLGNIAGAMFAQELLAYLETIPDDERQPLPELLVPVPLHWAKQLRRGFNQSEWIAHGIADVLGCQVCTPLKAQRHSTQTHRTAASRRTNVVGKFTLPDPSILNGAHITLVDDVITTGSTMRECILAIGCSGARPASIGILSLGLAGNTDI